MSKRRYVSEDAAEDESYKDAECPNCGAPLRLHFGKGRRTRRINCPVCKEKGTVSLEKEKLILPVLNQ